jgi:hypothetical protein
VAYFSVAKSQSKYLKVITYLRKNAMASTEVEESEKNYHQQGAMILDRNDTVFLNNYTLFVVYISLNSQLEATYLHI